MKKIHLLLIVKVFVLIPVMMVCQESNINLSYMAGKQPVLPQTDYMLLYGQLNFPSNEGFIACQDFTDFPEYTCQAADDFLIPDGQIWSISQIVAVGLFSPDNIMPQAVHVAIYSHDPVQQCPGTEIYYLPEVTFVASDYGTITVTLPEPVNLSNGIYWVSIQPAMLSTVGQWYWQKQESPTTLNQFCWRNPGGGFGIGCETWTASSMVPWGVEVEDHNLSFGIYGIPFEIPIVNCPPDLTIDINAAPITLTGAWPENGEYYGPGVIDGVFHALLAGIGDHLIIYSVSYPEFGWVGSCTFEITVNPPTQSVICGPGPHWIDNCVDYGLDVMESGALVGVNFDIMNCGLPPQQNLVLTGPVSVTTYGAQDIEVMDAGGNCNAYVDGHYDVIPTEILNMELTGSGMTLIAGKLNAPELQHSFGKIVEKPENSTLGCSFFDVYFKLLTPYGTLYNQAPLRIEAIIDRIPPWVTFSAQPGICIGLFTSPVEGQGVQLANLVQAQHTTLPEVIVCPADIEVMIDDPPFTLPDIYPTGGTYSGNGVTGSVFYPLYAGIGVHPITYSLNYPEFNYSTSCAFTIAVAGCPSVNAGPDAVITCGDAFHFTQATATNYQSLQWFTPDGTGYFEDENAVNPTYVPGTLDCTAGHVELCLVGMPILPCNQIVTDCMTLTILPVNQSVYYKDLLHTSLGNATLTKIGEETLIIGNIGSSGQDGVSVDVSDIPDLMYWEAQTTLDFETLAADASLSYAAVGDVPSAGEQVVCAANYLKQPDGSIYATVDFSNTGADSVLGQFFDDGILVHEEIIPSPTFDYSGTIGVKVSVGGDISWTKASLKIAFEWTKKTPNIITPNGVAILANGVHFYTLNSTPGITYNSFNLTAVYIPTITFTDETLVTGLQSVMYKDLLHTSLGSAALNKINEDTLVISNLGNSGLDGVSVDVSGIQNLEYWETQTSLDFETLPVDASLNYVAVGDIPSAGEQVVCAANYLKQPDGTMYATVDFSNTGASSVVGQFYNDGELVHQEIIPSPAFDYSGTIGVKVSVGGDISWTKASIKIEFEWTKKTPNIITPNGVAVLANSIHFYTLNSTPGITYNNFNLFATYIPTITFINAFVIVTSPVSDFGDAPSPFPTLLINNGARHTNDGVTFLGNQIDVENNGIPHPSALGDDLNNLPDEDGVVFPKPFTVGGISQVKVFASVNGYLNAWLDMNQNNSWADAGDQIFVDQPLSPGLNVLNVTIPATAKVGNTFARFRFNTTGGLTFTGSASNGEVEDYLIPMLPQDWGIVITSSTHIIAVPVSVNLTGLTLTSDDVLGVFYTTPSGDKCGGAAVWDGLNNQLVIAYGNDPLTAEKDGFSSGENMVWKVFFSATNTSSRIQAQYNPALPNADGKFYDNGLSALSALSSLTQILQIPANWSGISTYVVPFDPGVVNMFNPIINELTILQNGSDVYWPAQGVNTIGNWNVYKGYVIKVTTDVSLTVTGSEVDPKTITLNVGWNLIPVFKQVLTSSFFGGLPGFIIAKGIGTNEVYWPALGINTMPYLKTGKAYWVKTTLAGSLTYPDTKDEIIYQKPATLEVTTPWNELAVSPNTHLVAFSHACMRMFEPGDYIGAFTKTGLCAGAFIVNGEEGSVPLIMMGDDPTTLETEGFTENSTVSFRYWRKTTGETFDLAVTYDQRLDHSGLFSTQALSAVTDLKISGSIISNLSQAGLRIYPNPSQGTFTIAGTGSKIKATVFNTYGEEVYYDKSDLPAKIDISTQPSGIYFIRIESDNQVFFEKLIKE